MNRFVSKDGLDVVQVGRGAVTEYFISAQRGNLSDPKLVLAKVAQFLQTHGAQLVNLRIFGRPGVRETLVGENDGVLKQLDCPVTWLTQNEGAFELTAHGHAVSGAEVSSIDSEGKIAARTFQDENARYYHLSIVPENTDVDKTAQTREVYDRMDAILRSVGLDFSATARTWLFADQLLSWYDELNKARDAFFTEHRIFNKLVPASTGIGLGNPNGAAIVAEALAIQSLNGQVGIGKIASPMQCEALDYRSSFSRATFVTVPDHTRMYVSGTASIAPDGRTVHLNDTARQIELTMKVAEALIHKERMGWDNTVRAIAYFKNSFEFGLLDDYCRAAGISLPHVKIEADVCRDNLLFEIELDMLKYMSIPAIGSPY